MTLSERPPLKEPLTHVRRLPLPWRPSTAMLTECGRPGAMIDTTPLEERLIRRADQLIRVTGNGVYIGKIDESALLREAASEIARLRGEVERLAASAERVEGYERLQAQDIDDLTARADRAEAKIVELNKACQAFSDDADRLAAELAKTEETIRRLRDDFETAAEDHRIANARWYAAKAERDALREALRGLQNGTAHPDDRGRKGSEPCWCPTPDRGEWPPGPHGEECLAARALLSSSPASEPPA